ncbi:MAG: hypothetical protein IPP86_18305 [Bacteroidetes bacterium]|nr:hypothetical protein [Bacteroidota bacterium]
MEDKITITHTCLIEQGKAILNGQEIYSAAAKDTDGFLLSLYQHLGIKYPKFYKMDNLSKLGFLAGEMVLGNLSLTNTYKSEDISIVLYNANSSLDTDVRYFNTVKEMASPALFVYTLPNILIGELCIRHKINGENLFFIQEKFNASDLHHYVEYLLHENITQACLCGWVDCFGDQYKACLMWVEKKGEGQPFSPDTINKIYNQGNG